MWPCWNSQNPPGITARLFQLLLELLHHTLEDGLDRVDVGMIPSHPQVPHNSLQVELWERPSGHQTPQDQGSSIQECRLEKDGIEMGRNVRTMPLGDNAAGTEENKGIHGFCGDVGIG